MEQQGISVSPLEPEPLGHKHPFCFAMPFVPLVHQNNDLADINRKTQMVGVLPLVRQMRKAQ
jgi:hypothetical protein